MGVAHVMGHGKRNGRGRPGALRRLGAVMAVAAMCLLLAGTGLALADDEKDLSFYRLASATSSYYSLSQTTSDSDGKTVSQFVDDEAMDDASNMVQAGGLVGFSDEAEGIVGIIAKVSTGEQQIHYETFQNDGSQALYAYTAYGHALSSLGLDEVKGSADPIGTAVRAVSGNLMRFAYFFADSADSVMGAAVEFLRFLNPFTLFTDSDYMSAFMGQTAGSSTGDMVGPVRGTSASKADLAASIGSEEVGGILQPVRSVVSGYYDIAYRYGFALLVLGLVFLGASSIMRRRFDRPRAGRWVRRVAFILLGVPLLAFAYTGILDGIADNLGESGAGGSTQQDNVVMQTLVDFEGWSSNGGLALPEGYSVEVSCSDKGPGQVTRVSGPSGNAEVVYDGIVKAINDKWGRRVQEVSGDADQGVNAGLTDASGSVTKSAYAADLLDRYTNNSLYAASSFESSYKARLSAAARTELYEKINDVAQVSNLVKTTGNSYFHPDEDADEFDAEIGDGADSGYSALSAMHDGSPTALRAALSGQTAPDEEYGRVGYRGAKIVFSGGSCPEGSRGLSSLSTYNYLTTSFEESDIKTYGSGKLLSSMTVKSHNSANLAGGNFLVKAVNWAKAVSLLVAMGVVGWFYGISMIFTALKRLFMTVVQVPVALMGSLAGAAKLVTGVFLVVVEILLSVAVYTVLVDMIVSISTAVPQVVGNVVSRTPIAGTASVFGSVFNLLMVALNVLLVVVVVKARKGLVGAFDEMVGRTVDRVFDTASEGKDGQGAGHEMGDAINKAAPLGAGALSSAMDALGGKGAHDKGPQGEQAPPGAWDPDRDTDTAEDGPAGDVQDGSEGGPADAPVGSAEGPRDRGGEPTDADIARVADAAGAETCDDAVEAVYCGGDPVGGSFDGALDDYLPPDACEGGDGELSGADGSAPSEGVGEAPADGVRVDGAADGTSAAAVAAGRPADAPGALGTAGTSPDGVTASGGAPVPGAAAGLVGDDRDRHGSATAASAAVDGIEDAASAPSDGPGLSSMVAAREASRAASARDRALADAIGAPEAPGAEDAAPGAAAPSKPWSAVDDHIDGAYDQRHKGSLSEPPTAAARRMAPLADAAAKAVGGAERLGHHLGNRAQVDQVTQREQVDDLIRLQKAALVSQSTGEPARVPRLHSDQYGAGPRTGTGAGSGLAAAAGGVARAAAEAGTDARDRAAYGRHLQAATAHREARDAAVRLRRDLSGPAGTRTKGSKERLERMLRSCDSDGACRLARAARSLQETDGLVQSVASSLRAGGQGTAAAAAAADPATRQALLDLPSVVRDLHDDYAAGAVAADDAGSRAAKAYLFAHPEAMERALSVAQAIGESRLGAAASAASREGGS